VRIHTVMAAERPGTRSIDDEAPSVCVCRSITMFSAAVCKGGTNGTNGTHECTKYVRYVRDAGYKQASVPCFALCSTNAYCDTCAMHFSVRTRGDARRLQLQLPLTPVQTDATKDEKGCNQPHMTHWVKDSTNPS
jgi:hypothetical protein